MSEKLQKVLAARGYGSRRHMETWISEGRIRVNGRPATLGMRVTDKDRIQVNGRPIREATGDKTRILMVNKPAGVICTRRDPEKRPNVFSLLPPLKNGRWVIVGRLDLNTSGLLLATNNGEIAHRLMHPSGELEREYSVRVYGEVDKAMLARLKKGVDIDGQKMKFKSIREGEVSGRNQWFQVVLTEGRYREVRRLWESQGVKVSRLIRIRFGTICLPRNLRATAWKELGESQIEKLLQAVASDS